MRLLICFFFLLALNAQAKKVFKKFYEGVDYKASAQAGYPWFARLDGTLGYGIIFWGKKVQEPKEFDDALYGYIRPNARLQSAGLMNNAELRLDLYPISFAGLTVGQVFSHSALGVLGDTSENTGLDCSTVQCGGLLFRSFMEAKLKGGYDRYFGVLFYRWDFLVNTGKQSYAFADLSNSLVGGGRSDLLETQWIKMGMKLDEEWSAGIHLEHNAMKGTRQHAYKEQIFAVYKYSDDWAYGGAVKFMQTPVDRFAVGLGVQVDWSGKASVEL